MYPIVKQNNNDKTKNGLELTEEDMCKIADHTLHSNDYVSRRSFNVT